MKKLRWYNLLFDFSISQFSKRLQSKLFTPDADEGFLIRRIRKDLIEASYIEKNIFNETLLDPLGHEFSQRRVVYKNIEFKIHNNAPCLELINPPRGILGFSALLSEITDFEITINPIEIDVLSWINLIKKEIPLSARAIQATDVPFSSNISGEIIAKSESDLLPSISKIPNLKHGKIKKINIMTQFGNSQQNFIISSTSSLSSGNPINPDFAQTALSALRTLISPI